MKFFVVYEMGEGTVGCFLTKREAVAFGSSWCVNFSVTAMEVAVNADTVCRLLGNQGGYAKNMKEIYRKEEEE